MSGNTEKPGCPDETEGRQEPPPSQPKKKRAKLVVKEVTVASTNEKITPQPREIKAANLRGREEPADAGPETEEEITRLERPQTVQEPMEKSSTAKFEKIEDAPDSEEQRELAWQQPMAAGWWVLIGGGVLVLLLVGAVMLSNHMDGLKMEEVAGPDIALDVDDPFAGNPEQWFHHRAGRVSAEAIDLMRAYAKAKDDAGRSKLVRKPGQYMKLAPGWPVEVCPRLEGVDNSQWSIDHTGQTAFLILDTEDRDFLPTRLYFTRRGDGLKLDWQASTAWSERSIGELKKAMQAREKKIEASGDAAELPPPVIGEPLLLRCLLFRRNEFYAGPYNDKDHAAFMILSPDKSEYLWAYVDRDSALDLELRELLNHGRFVVDLKKNIRVTVRVRSGKKDALPSQLELVELVNPEWVTP